MTNFTMSQTRRQLGRWLILACLCLIGGSAWSADRALLVGVTEYENLPKNFWLTGPGQDVYMFRQTLIDRFGYTEEGIRILSEAEAKARDASHLPTKAAIMGALDDLAAQALASAVAGETDRIVIMMGGHGTRAPRKPKPGDSNPHALSGLFLPRDIASWDEEIEEVPGAIKDEELAVKLKAILDTGAHVWLIMDSCHSGGMARDKARAMGDPSETARDLPTEALGIPAATVAAAVKREAAATEGSRGVGDPATSGFESAIDMPNLAAIYACRVIEQTYERNFPPDAGKFGILSYTLCRVLNSTPTPLTYAELTRRVNLEYEAMGRNGRPVALVEGKGQDHFVLDAEKTRESRVRIQFDKDDLMTIDAGNLHGMTVGSVLAVYPPAGDANPDSIVGHVQVVSTEAARSYVVPCEYGDMAAPETYKKESICRLVYREFDISPIQVAVAPEVRSDAAVFTALTNNGANGRLYELVEGDTFPWLLTYVERANRPRAVALVNTASGKEFLAPIGTADPAAWVVESLGAVARVQGVLQVAAGATGGGELKVTVELVLDPKTKPVAIDLSQDVDLYLRDHIGLRITNTGDTAVDVCVLFVDSNYAIQQVYPLRGQTGDNHIRPGDHRIAAPGRIDAASDGQERFVVIAVPGNLEDPANFAMLESQGFTLDEDLAMRAKLGGLEKALWFNKTRTGDEGHRGYSADEMDTVYTIHDIKWSTHRKLRPVAPRRAPAPPSATTD